MRICFWVTSVIKLGGVQQVTRAIAEAKHWLKSTMWWL